MLYIQALTTINEEFIIIGTLFAKEACKTEAQDYNTDKTPNNIKP